ncbi:L domain-like protein [Rhizoclosmatium globosum]|uniref:L domain-like protein n=1 Tax=Rhizoclosmatium globosum TaxID=329046 RepID=A0A1Y2CE33_9FUNG|nr:L domain-like protein [Rhizoclosmatium globosum]|eukprot:ORY44565.1 L domain-like protein [Rhizoclosmatium globosum]
MTDLIQQEKARVLDISLVPTELILLIFSWLHPQTVHKFRRLNQWFHSNLSARHFTHMTMKRIFPNIHCQISDVRRPTKSKASSLDIICVAWCEAFQTSYIQRHLSVFSEIHWQSTKFPIASSSHFGNLVGRLEHLIELNLSSCNISGHIPIQIGNLIHLQRLLLDENELSGPIPPELSTLTELRTLSLSRNKLTGRIPEFLERFNELQVINLSQNQLQGPIPTFLGTLSHLQQIKLDNCNLSGFIPDALGNLVHLELLHLQNNKHIIGGVPPTFSALTEIQEVKLGGTKFTCFFPLISLAVRGSGVC